MLKINKIKIIFKKIWLLKFNYSSDKSISLVKYLTGNSNISTKGRIFYDKTKISEYNPYYWNKKLAAHNDWVWEKNINPIYLLLRCKTKAISWWESLFIDSKKILKFIPNSYLKLKYVYSLFDDVEESLIVEHPLYWYLCLNYTLYEVNSNWNSKYIKFLWVTEKENKNINSFLFKLLEENTFYIDLKENESILFDNYRYLHWRNSFTWYRELDRRLVYL